MRPGFWSRPMAGFPIAFWAATATFLVLWSSTAATPLPNRLDAEADHALERWRPGDDAGWGDNERKILLEYSLLAVADLALVAAAWTFGNPRLGIGLALSILLHESFLRALAFASAKPPPPGAYASDSSFPSGLVAAWALAVSLFLLVVRPRITLDEAVSPPDAAMAGSLVLLYAGFRFLSGEQWVTDIVAGAALGGAWAFATRRALRDWARNAKP